MTRRDTLRLLALTLAVSSAPACGPASAEIVVDTGPPPDRVEVVGLAPYPGAIWIRGHWQWSGGRHVWYPGFWERPRVGFMWEHAHWDRWGNRWRFIPGHWRRI
jgi:hypothetical protein